MAEMRQQWSCSYLPYYTTSTVVTHRHFKTLCHSLSGENFVLKHLEIVLFVFVKQEIYKNIYIATD